MIYTEIHGDIFDAPEEYYLVHCISSDLAMGRGIAVKMNNTFQLRNELRKSHIIMPSAVLVNRVFNLITKDKYWHKPTYSTIGKALQFMKAICVMHGIKKLAMPTIGCGLDKLQWNEVKRIIQHIFYHTEVEIIVYFYKPKIKEIHYI